MVVKVELSNALIFELALEGLQSLLVKRGHWYLRAWNQQLSKIAHLWLLLQAYLRLLVKQAPEYFISHSTVSVPLHIVLETHW